jgi:hypothetical protein
VIREGVQKGGVFDRVGCDEPVDFFSGRRRLGNDDSETLANAFGDDVEMSACGRGFLGDTRLDRDEALVVSVEPGIDIVKALAVPVEPPAGCG